MVVLIQKIALFAAILRYKKHMQELKRASVAGMFYPADRDELDQELSRLLERADVVPAANPAALIVPHAGYQYSGGIAASGFNSIAATPVKTVAIIGPAHRVAFESVATLSAAALETPLGEVAVDDALREVALAAGALSFDRAFQQEHCIEVELPFIQRLFPAASVLPLLVSRSATDEVATILSALYHSGAFIVVSSDLSHYLSRQEAERCDRSTLRAISALQPERVADDGACGAGAIRGLLALAKEEGLQASVVQSGTSGDADGSTDRVVGYGSVVFTLPV